MVRVLIVDDELSIRETLTEFLRDDGYDVASAESASEALELHEARPFDIVVSDIIMPQIDGLELMRRLQEMALNVKVILITGEPTFETAAEAIRGGAFDYVPKPINERTVRRVVNQAAQLHLLEMENRRYRQRLEELVEERTRQLAAYSVKLKESEEKYRALSENSCIGIYIVQNGRTQYLNRRFAEMLGYSAEDVEALRRRGLLDLIHPDDRVPTDGRLSALSRHEPLELRLQHKSGETIWAEVLISPIEHQGQPALIGNVIDVTERKRSQEDKAELERQLLQAQKMEAIGRLAGGMAHDFNNLLTGIMGFADLARMMTSPDDPLYAHLAEINRATVRARGLTNQLLAFSRKQLVSPKVIVINDTIEQAKRMLERLIGEDITLEFFPRGEAWPVKIDPTQLDQVLVNLATNARDAMPDGGTLTIETRPVILSDELLPSTSAREGDFVVLSVTDSGHGMSQDTLEHIFEPFFSTKAAGKGTGLGLSTVYGIVSQNDGFIVVSSQVGGGTSFQIYLPRTHDSDFEPAPVSGLIGNPSGSETVLLVEDDEVVRALSRSILEQQGYTILEAPNPLRALSLAREHGDRIALLLSDVVMPMMSGRELEDRIRSYVPDIRTLFMSGYPADIVAQHGVIQSDTNLIQKPFSVQMLTEKVRVVLDGGAEDVSPLPEVSQDP